jgi:hypothetical protein
VHSFDAAFSRLQRSSDPANKSPAIPDRPKRDSIDSLFSPSRSQSRAASPLRFIQQWSASLYRGHFRDDPFVPVDPFQLHSRFPCISHMPNGQDPHLDCNCRDGQICCLPLPTTLCISSTSPFRTALTTTSNFLTDILPRQLYLHILLRLPSLYFSRVARIFEEAEVSRPDIQRMIDAYIVGMSWDNVATSADAGRPSGNYAGMLSPRPPTGPGAQAMVSMPPTLPFPEDWNPPAVSPALARFKVSWEAFIDSLLREWKTLNVVSALLLSYVAFLTHARSS